MCTFQWHEGVQDRDRFDQRLRALVRHPGEVHGRHQGGLESALHHGLHRGHPQRQVRQVRLHRLLAESMRVAVHQNKVKVRVRGLIPTRAANPDHTLMANERR